MRARNLRPGFYKNEDLAECSFAARLLFTGLWCLSDRVGYLKDRPKRIKIEIFPYDAELDIEPLLNELASHNFIIRYEAEGDRYIYIPGFRNNQHPHINESSFGYPEYDSEKHSDSKQYDTSTIQAPCEHDTSTIQNRMKYEICNMTDDSPNRENVRIDSDNGTEPPFEKATPSQGKVFEDLEDNAPSSEEDSPQNDKQAVNLLEEWFNKFFQHYPRRDSKKKAHQTFMAVFKGIPPQRQRHRMENIVLRLTRYAHDRKDEDPKYTKLPTTWLNSYDWDETPSESECLMAERWVPCEERGGV